MESKVSVDLKAPSPYIEKNSGFHRLRRNLSYAFALKKIRAEHSGKENFTILEIGTGSGYFLLSANRWFPRATLAGVEYDERLLQVTRSKVPLANCIQGNAETFDLRPAQFDAVVSFQVIEHLYNPNAMLDRVKEHLKPGGIFIVTTPNLDGIGARLMGTKWHGYREDHVSLKGYAGWIQYICDAGFAPVYCGSTFFTGIPAFTKLPLGALNWFLLVVLGSARWRWGESFVGVFKCSDQ